MLSKPVGPTTQKVTETHNTVTITTTTVIRKERVGVILALRRKDGSIGIGFSLCRRHAPRVIGCLYGKPAVDIGDCYDETTAINMATERANGLVDYDVPQSIIKDFQAMTARAAKFFKVPAEECGSLVKIQGPIEAKGA